MTIISYNPATGVAEEEVAEATTAAEVADLCIRAASATGALRDMKRSGRARLLRAMAAELEGARERIVAIADRETALGEVRLNKELIRTCFQLRLFAEVLDDGSYLEVTLDPASETGMGPRPDLRRMLFPLGPVAVFGASNFPLAFSVPGGDTAAAIAAGCPVVIKAHSAHPATSLLVFECLERAAVSEGAPTGTLALVFGREAGAALVQDPRIKAVGFTGSEAGGRALFDMANARPEPIPFYGELGSINPLVVSPLAAKNRAGEIARGYVESITTGAGQFCTKPGLMFVPESCAREVREALASALAEKPSAWLLSESIRDAFLGGVTVLKENKGIELAFGGQESDQPGYSAEPALFWTTTDQLEVAQSAAYEECFGPSGVVVQYRDEADLAQALSRTPGTLTGTIHAEEGEDQFAAPVLEVLSSRAGRIIWNGFPTGVSVSWSMTHGGPYPSSTAPLHTSVGATSIRRFLRPITFQSVPPSLLPDELRDEGAGSVPRRMDGTLFS